MTAQNIEYKERKNPPVEVHTSDESISSSLADSAAALLLAAILLPVKITYGGKISSDLCPIIEPTNVSSFRHWMGDPCDGKARSHPVHPSLQTPRAAPRGGLTLP